MKFSTQIKPISYLKANTTAVIRELTEKRSPLVITQNGKATAVLQDVVSYDETQEALAMLKILALGNHQFQQGKGIPAKQALRRARARLAQK
jgi:prevent-host-death family protein